VPTTSKASKPINDFDTKAMEGSIIEELSRKFETVSLANVNRRTQKGKETYKCLWCDSLDHQKCDCCHGTVRRDGTMEIQGEMMKET
jgi:predicted methyltransferase